MLIPLWLLSVPNAAAWRHEGHAWATLPVAACIDDAGVDPSWRAEASAALEAWNDGLEVFEVVEDCEAAALRVVLAPGDSGSHTVETDGPAVDIDGVDYDGATTATVELGVDWLLAQADIEGGDCTQGTSARRVLSHELGHVLGLSHSCDEGEVCNDGDLLAAVMFWTVSPCETVFEPQADDLAGLDALYGIPTPGGTEPSDTDDPADTDAPANSDTATSEEPGGCGCRATPTAPPLAALLGLLALARRRARP